MPASYERSLFEKKVLARYSVGNFYTNRFTNIAMSNASAKPSTKPQASPATQEAQPTPAQHSGLGRRSSDASTDKNRVWKPVIARLGDVEARVAKILSKSGVSLPADTATAIIVDAALKAIGNGPSEAEIWDAVLARERVRLESLQKLRAGATP